MTMRDRIDPRARQGMVIVAFVYLVGWSLGRAQGRVEATARLLERMDAAKPRSRRT